METWENLSRSQMIVNDKQIKWRQSVVYTFLNLLPVNISDIRPPRARVKIRTNDCCRRWKARIRRESSISYTVTLATRWTLGSGQTSVSFLSLLSGRSDQTNQTWVTLQVEKNRTRRTNNDYSGVLLCVDRQVTNRYCAGIDESFIFTSKRDFQTVAKIF